MEVGQTRDYDPVRVDSLVRTMRFDYADFRTEVLESNYDVGELRRVELKVARDFVRRGYHQETTQGFWIHSISRPDVNHVVVSFSVPSSYEFGASARQSETPDDSEALIPNGDLRHVIGNRQVGTERLTLTQEQITSCRAVLGLTQNRLLTREQIELIFTESIYANLSVIHGPDEANNPLWRNNVELKTYARDDSNYFVTFNFVPVVHPAERRQEEKYFLAKMKADKEGRYWVDEIIQPNHFRLEIVGANNGIIVFPPRCNSSGLFGVDVFESPIVGVFREALDTPDGCELVQFITIRERESRYAIRGEYFPQDKFVGWCDSAHFCLQMGTNALTNPKEKIMYLVEEDTSLDIGRSRILRPHIDFTIVEHHTYLELALRYIPAPNTRIALYRKGKTDPRFSEATRTSSLLASTGRTYKIPTSIAGGISDLAFGYHCESGGRQSKPIHRPAPVQPVPEPPKAKPRGRRSRADILGDSVLPYQD